VTGLGSPLRYSKNVILFTVSTENEGKTQGYECDEGNKTTGRRIKIKKRLPIEFQRGFH
jgi:hypothetical protein